MSRDELGCGVGKMKLMLTCKDASRLISKSLDRPLSWSDRMKLKFHLFICDACNRFNVQLGQLRSAVKRMRHEAENDESIQLPLDVKARIASQMTSTAESKNS